ncbi:hypothetical protein BH23CYA1_BH23CYA1_14940 [soil metagenome]
MDDMEVSWRNSVISELQPYVAQRQRRKAEMRSRLQARHQAGLQQAKILADILKAEFGATQVVLSIRERLRLSHSTAQ